jgi:hypothetical protein
VTTTIRKEMRGMNIIISAFLGCLVGVGGTYCTLVGSPAILVEFAVLIILCIAGFYLITKKSKFAGYECEICGAEYDQCEHKTLEDYTLIKK